MKIVRAERIPLNLPFYHHRVARAMHRASTHGERVWVVRLESDNGLVGWGDDLGWDQYWDFGGPPPPRPEVDHLVGRNPAELIHRDALGFAVQVALLDLVARDNGVPVHALLGSQVRDRCPVSWWDIDMPPEDWAAEARQSRRRGYTSFKMKARPWRDIFAQVEAVAAVVPPDYKFDIDFNGFLLNQARSEVFLAELDHYPNVGMYETPFNLNSDLDGARILRERVVKPLIEHFSDPVWAADCCDGFVVLGGVSAMRRDAALAAAGNKSFWLQLVGTGITTAFAIQLGSVLSHAQLPYITCHELWVDDLLKKPIVVLFWNVADSDAKTQLTSLGAIKSHLGEGVETVAIHTDESTQKEAHQLYLSMPGTTAQLWGDMEVAGQFGVTSSSALVVIDRNGRICLTRTGPAEVLFKEMNEYVETL